MGMTVAMRDGEAEGAADVASAREKLAAAKSTLWQVRRQAAEMAAKAQARTREEMSRRRSDAALRLEHLAELVRPQDNAGAMAVRHRRLLVTGGSSLALAGALCLGVAIGYTLSRRRRSRRLAKTQDQLVSRADQARANLGGAVDQSTDTLPIGAAGLP